MSFQPFATQVSFSESLRVNGALTLDSGHLLFRVGQWEIWESKEKRAPGASLTKSMGKADLGLKFHRLLNKEVSVGQA